MQLLGTERCHNSSFIKFINLPLNYILQDCLWTESNNYCILFFYKIDLQSALQCESDKFIYINYYPHYFANNHNITVINNSITAFRKTSHWSKFQAFQILWK